MEILNRGSNKKKHKVDNNKRSLTETRYERTNSVHRAQDGIRCQIFEDFVRRIS